MDLTFLPKIIFDALTHVDINYLYEIRLRKGFSIILNFNGERVYLTKNGVSKLKNFAIVCDERFIEEIINNVTEHSIYLYNDQIRQGYITTKSAIRIGIAGECVLDNGQVVTIKNMTSLNIRIPHDIKNCSDKIFNLLFNKNKIYNSLIIGLPTTGKTTILKDLVEKINNEYNYSILIIDERGELNCKGENIDVIKNSDKQFAFNYAIRSLSPNLVITDEIATKSDWDFIKTTINCGINVIASCHSNDVLKLKSKEIFIDKLFDRYFILDDSSKIGQIKDVFDKEFNKI